MNANTNTGAVGMARKCAECLKPLGGYERAFSGIYKGHCHECHERLMVPCGPTWDADDERWLGRNAPDA